MVLAELGRYFSSGQDLREFLQACQIDYHPLSMDAVVEAVRIMRGYAKNKGPRERTAPDL